MTVAGGIPLTTRLGAALAENNTTAGSDAATGLEKLGSGGVFELIEQYFLPFIVIFIGLLLLILIPIILKYRASKPTKKDLQFAENELQKRKLELLKKREMIEELKLAAIIPTDRERSEMAAVDLDNAILSRKIAHTMNEVDRRTKRLELGADTAKLFETLTDVKEHEKGLFGKTL